MAKPWKFEQLGGDRRVFLLDGWSAPFGRRRQSPVVTTTQQVRRERIRYPGSSNVTRHVFGTQEDDQELKGRFMDRALGPGGALVKAAELRAFQADQQPIQFGWGDVILYTGFMVEVALEYEAETDIAWTIKLEIDKDDFSEGPGKSLIDPSGGSAQAFASMSAAFSEVKDGIEAQSLTGKVSGFIDDGLSALSSGIDSIGDIIGQATTLRDAPFGKLNRLVSEIERFRDKAISVRELFVSIPEDATRFATRAQDVAKFRGTQMQVERQMREALSAGATIQRSAETVMIGRVRTTYTAGDGDTWESISTRFYGKPDRAGDVREANDIPAGQNPIAGFEYLIPK